MRSLLFRRFAAFCSSSNIPKVTSQAQTDLVADIPLTPEALAELEDFKNMIESGNIDPNKMVGLFEIED